MTPGEAIRATSLRIQNTVRFTGTKARARLPRAANALRNAELDTFHGRPSPSPPGTVPGRRSGHLRGRWFPKQNGSGTEMMFGIWSGVNYSAYLEHGTSKMAARPFVDKIVETAMPDIRSIFEELGE